MQPVLNAVEMRRADKRAVDMGIPELVLMENAARGTCDLLERIAREGLRPDPAIVIFCGMGNNGGDGVAVVRHALNRRLNAIAVLVGNREGASPSMKTQLRILEAIDSTSVVSFDSFRRRRQPVDIAVDALLGTGSGGAPRSPISSAITWINDHAPRVLAVDIPSGIDATTGMAEGVAVRAGWTATMGALKHGLLMGAGRDHAGAISIIDIGAPQRVYHETNFWLLDADAARARLPETRTERHKYDRGKTLVVGSSVGMTGAGILAATSALRSGAGLSVLAAPEIALAHTPQPVPPEVMLRQIGREGPSAEALQDLLLGGEFFDAIACGPGLGRTREAAEVVRLLLGECEVPLILDADALHPFAGMVRGLKRRMGPLIITPHHGEMAHLLGVAREAVTRDPCMVARDAARAIDGIVVLKGAPTVVASPHGEMWINGAGNPGMATAGSGDVLTGTLAALVARRDDVFDAALAGVFLHSHAADCAARRRGMNGMTAGDIVQELPEAARELHGVR